MDRIGILIDVWGQRAGLKLLGSYMLVSPNLLGNLRDRFSILDKCSMDGPQATLDGGGLERTHFRRPAILKGAHVGQTYILPGVATFRQDSVREILFQLLSGADLRSLQ